MTDQVSGDRDLAVPRLSDERARRNRRKAIILAILLALLAALLYSLWYWNNNKQLPIPVIRTADALQAPQYLYSISGAGKSEAELRRPLGVAVSDDGRVYVADSYSRKVKVFTVPGRYLFSFDKIADGGSKALRNPVRVEVDNDANVWVVDRTLNGIYVFDRDGKFLRTFRPAGIDKAGWSPAGISFDSSGTIYVTDTGQTKKHQVYVFDAAGKKLAQFGSTEMVRNPADGLGKFYFPNRVAVYDGVLLVADADNRRLQAFDPKGAFKYMVATGGTPRGMYIDRKGHVFVSDALAHVVDIYTMKGEKLVTFGENGVGPGQFQFPGDVTLDKTERLIFVSDRVNNQVQVWGWPVGRPELPPVPGGLPTYLLICLSPLLLLLLPLLRRKRRFVVTDDFVEAMVTVDQVPMMVNRKWTWVMPEEVQKKYYGRVESGVDLGDLIKGEPYSYTEAQELSVRLGISMEEAVILSMAKRTGMLFTQDPELRKLGGLLDVDVYDRDEFLQVFGRDVTTGTASK